MSGPPAAVAASGAPCPRDVTAHTRTLAARGTHRSRRHSAILGNVVLDTKGPGIMVYGATGVASPNLVERNVVSGSRHSAGIVVGGGPALVRNNVLALNAEAGIDITDYGRRGLLRQVSVVHNSILQRHRSGIALARDRVHDVTVAFNAVRVADGGPALPAPRAGLRLAGNVDCSRSDCFRDPDRWDFSPSHQLAVDVAAAASVDLAPDDFFGVARGDRRAAGAIDRPAEALLLDPPNHP
jgi:hypothetical protein